MLAAYHEGKQIALHRLSYRKKEMLVNAGHYRRLTVKQRSDAENTLTDEGNVIGFPVKPHDLSRYGEACLCEADATEPQGTRDAGPGSPHSEWPGRPVCEANEMAVF